MSKKDSFILEVAISGQIHSTFKWQMQSNIFISVMEEFSWWHEHIVWTYSWGCQFAEEGAMEISLMAVKRTGRSKRGLAHEKQEAQEALNLGEASQWFY